MALKCLIFNERATTPDCKFPLASLRWEHIIYNHAHGDRLAFYSWSPATYWTLGQAHVTRPSLQEVIYWGADKAFSARVKASPGFNSFEVHKGLSHLNAGSFWTERPPFYASILGWISFWLSVSSIHAGAQPQHLGTCACSGQSTPSLDTPGGNFPSQESNRSHACWPSLFFFFLQTG